MIRRGATIVLATSLIIANSARAQRGQKLPPPPSPVREQQVRPGAERQALLQQIHQQFMKKARNVLGLTQGQFPRFQRVLATNAQKRLPLELEEDRLRSALGEQVRLRAAGNQDSTARLLAALKKTRGDLATVDEDELRDLGSVLTPVQQAQWQAMRERFREQVRAATQPRLNGGPTPEP